ncbi:MAG TPA: hypothetical protein VMD53_18135 [Rhizomicrobium sp.]|nr:hypothetical protein [Rhizomicrobium sp.]
MNAKHFVALAGAISLAGLFIPSAAAEAQTVNVTYDYVYLASGPHMRQPRSTGVNGFYPIQSNSGGQETPNDKFTPGLPPCGLSAVSHQLRHGIQVTTVTNYMFMFMSLNGGSPTQAGNPAAVQSFTCMGQPPSIYVENAPIQVLVVYTPTGGGGGEDSGATIDSFNATAGVLFDDTFVSVAPDATGTLTTSGNTNGWVDTWNSAEEITALQPTIEWPTKNHRSDTFTDWVSSNGSGSTASTNPALAVNKEQSVTAIAFYNVPWQFFDGATSAYCAGPVSIQDCQQGGALAGHIPNPTGAH